MRRIAVVVGQALILTATCLFGMGAGKRELAVRASSPARIQRVLLVSIDGLHALDLAIFVKSNPDSALARLSAKGVTYTQAFTSKPSDSFPGLLSMVTGGSPISTGVWYEGSYARELSPSGSNCKSVGTVVVWDSSVDRDKKAVDGGGIDPAKLPLDPRKGCAPVFPHNYLRVNTVFEVVHQAKMRTAWCDKHPSYEMVNGPSSLGVDDLYTPEIVASGAVHNLHAAEAYDDLKVQAVLNEIDGRDHTGARSLGVPALWGMSLQEVSVAQKLAGGGYSDAMGTPSPDLHDALSHIDHSLGKISRALGSRGLAASTLIIITAKHGESPIDVKKRRIIPDSILPKIINRSHPGVLALAYQDGDLASIWLRDQSQTNNVVETLSQPGDESVLDVQQILAGESLKLLFNDPLRDIRTPDIVLIPNLGGIYTEADSQFIAEHGGFSDEDTHVALLVSNPRLKPGLIKTPVQTRQIAPTILASLGLDPRALQAVQIEKTRVLQGLFEAGAYESEYPLSGVLADHAGGGHPGTGSR